MLEDLVWPGCDDDVELDTHARFAALSREEAGDSQIGRAFAEPHKTLSSKGYVEGKYLDRERSSIHALAPRIQCKQIEFVQFVGPALCDIDRWRVDD